MAAAVSNSLAAATVLMHRLPVTNRAAVFSPLPVRPSLSSTAFKQLKEKGRSPQLMVKATSSEESSLDASELFTDLKEKWDGIENKPTVLLYGGGAIVAVWLASIVVSAVNSVPLLPKIMELVGLGYTGWFVYRYLLFKTSRKELETDIEEFKKKISGAE
ncbi:protein CURVATURE THYLAKOID 1A, chloroplastic [Dorcoceras hygrometricum]|uniref:Protein CURVATURE THYLAKOID 1A, chloroplastic n=1 Tax=Dorcoceras hygrometricum TaxID=472368 RepID=A0A2Z7C0H8_9LAMI|nr:protein CURVATURE THYLAKOID 1A, chloroplastic [Dorcoceras hygrometricum]